MTRVKNTRDRFLRRGNLSKCRGIFLKKFENLVISRETIFSKSNEIKRKKTWLLVIWNSCNFEELTGNVAESQLQTLVGERFANIREDLQVFTKIHPKIHRRETVYLHSSTIT